MGEDPETTSRQLGSGQADEQDVLEHPSRQRHPIDPGRLPQLVGHLPDQTGDRQVEPGRDRANRTAVAKVADDARPAPGPGRSGRPGHANR